METDIKKSSFVNKEITLKKLYKFSYSFLNSEVDYESFHESMKNVKWKVYLLEFKKKYFATYKGNLNTIMLSKILREILDIDGNPPLQVKIREDRPAWTFILTKSEFIFNLNSLISTWNEKESKIPEKSYFHLLSNDLHILLMSHLNYLQIRDYCFWDMKLNIFLTSPQSIIWKILLKRDYSNTHEPRVRNPRKTILMRKGSDKTRYKVLLGEKDIKSSRNISDGIPFRPIAR